MNITLMYKDQSTFDLMVNGAEVNCSPLTVESQETDAYTAAVPGGVLLLIFPNESCWMFSPDLSDTKPRRMPVEVRRMQ